MGRALVNKNKMASGGKAKKLPKKVKKYSGGTTDAGSEDEGMSVAEGGALGGAALSTTGNLIAPAFNDAASQNVVKSASSAAGTGMAIGATAGPLGAAIGAGAGAILGTTTALIANAKMKKEEAARKKKIQEALETQLRDLKLETTDVFSTKESDYNNLRVKDGAFTSAPRGKGRPSAFMAEGGVVDGEGGPKDDAIRTTLKESSVVVPAENAAMAEALRADMLPKKGGKMKAGGKVPVALSDGEHVFTPEEKKKIDKALSERGVDPNAVWNTLIPNPSPGNELADGTKNVKDIIKGVKPNPFVVNALKDKPKPKQKVENISFEDFVLQAKKDFKSMPRQKYIEKYGYDNAEPVNLRNSYAAKTGNPRPKVDSSEYDKAVIDADRKKIVGPDPTKITKKTPAKKQEPSKSVKEIIASVEKTNFIKGVDSLLDGTKKESNSVASSKKKESTSASVPKEQTKNKVQPTKLDLGSGVKTPEILAGIEPSRWLQNSGLLSEKDKNDLARKRKEEADSIIMELGLSDQFKKANADANASAEDYLKKRYPGKTLGEIRAGIAAAGKSKPATAAPATTPATGSGKGSGKPKTTTIADPNPTGGLPSTLPRTDGGFYDFPEDEADKNKVKEALTPPATTNEVTDPWADKSKSSNTAQGETLSAGQILALGQTLGGMLTASEKRPEDTMNPIFVSRVATAIGNAEAAKEEAKYGFTYKQRNAISQGLEESRRGAMAGTLQSGAGSAGLSAALRGLSQDKNRALIDVEAKDAEVRQMKQGRADQVSAQADNMAGALDQRGRQIFADDLDEHWKNAAAASDLMNAGLTNFFNAIEDRKIEKERAKRNTQPVYLTTSAPTTEKKG
jgi:hypothetical protein